MDKDTKIYISGHRGMVGAALMRALEQQGYTNLVTRSRDTLDLCNAAAVNDFFAEERPEVVLLAAARVGGIVANNSYPAEFMHDNLCIEHNIIHAAWRHHVKRLLFLGSSCIYPREAPQPIREEYLLTSPLEQTNEAYALAKIIGLKLCEYYRRQYGVLFHSAMPTNLYGPGDYYHRENSHVIPGLLRRFHEAKEAGLSSVQLWGTGTARREFLHVDDLSEGLLYLLKVENPPDWVNIGYGEDISIGELATLVNDIVGFKGEISYDTSRPDGTPRKLLDVSKMHDLGWSAKIQLREGLESTYACFLSALKAGTLRE